MKKLFALSILCMFFLQLSVYGAEGEIGQMGGVSEGMNLPKTIEKYVDIPSSTTNTYQYKEVVFITGEPVVFEGTIIVNLNDTNVLEDVSGSYTETYTVDATNTALSATLERNMTFVTYFNVIEKDFKKQVVTSSELSTWSEDVTVGDVTYTLDEDASSFSKAGVKDMTPGVDYFSTTVSYVAKYSNGEDDDVTMDVAGTNYGYDQPWSKVETQNRDISITHTLDTMDAMSVSTTSVLEANKTIYYDETEPFPISFDGTYNQRMERESVLTYEIHSFHSDLEADQYDGSVTISTAKEIEKLPIPQNLEFIEGHWAEEDFKKLYSMEIFTEIPHSGMQYEAISRGDFIKALCLAMNIDITVYEDEDYNEVIFGDVTKEHPLYPYVTAAYEKKLVKGTGAEFDVDRPINREEAFVVYIRVIGLERLGVTNAPLTPFVDDDAISDWAKKEIMAGYKLGIIQGDERGNVNPKQWISKSEAAAIVNRLIDYLREDISTDYKK